MHVRFNCAYMMGLCPRAPSIDPPKKRLSDSNFANRPEFLQQNLPQSFLEIILRDFVFLCVRYMPKTQYKNMKGTKNGHQVPPPLPLDNGDREDEKSLMDSEDPSDFVDEHGFEAESFHKERKNERQRNTLQLLLSSSFV